MTSWRSVCCLLVRRHGRSCSSSDFTCRLCRNKVERKWTSLFGWGLLHDSILNGNLQAQHKFFSRERVKQISNWQTALPTTANRDPKQGRKLAWKQTPKQRTPGSSSCLWASCNFALSIFLQLKIHFAWNLSSSKCNYFDPLFISEG